MEEGKTEIIDQSPARSRTLFTWGAIASGAWIGGIFVWALLAWPSFAKMPPNEWGDFFAGAAAPLGFLWLVLGFVQQGIELKQNSHALHLQAIELRNQSAELRNSVEQQKALVDATREDIEMRRTLDGERLEEAIRKQEQKRQDEEIARISPSLRFAALSGNVVRVTNVGATCRNLSIPSVPITFFRVARQIDVPEFATNATLDVEFTVPRQREVTRLTFTYETSDGVKRRQEFETVYEPGMSNPITVYYPGTRPRRAR